MIRTDSVQIPCAIPSTLRPESGDRERGRRRGREMHVASNVPAPAPPGPHDEPEPDPATPDWPYPDGPTCDHGMPGGNQPDPVLGGRPACPQCARDTARTTRSTR